MSIEDRLQSGGRAWRESQPPVAVAPVAGVRRRPVLWLPLTAAAATVAVVVGASLLVSRDDSPAPVASGVVPYAELRPTEADVPAPGRFVSFPAVSGPFISTCEQGDVSGAFEVVAEGRGRLRFLATGDRPCLLESQDGLQISTVSGRGGEFAAKAAEPRRWAGDDGPVRRTAGRDPLLVDVDFTGLCLQGGRLTVEGVVPGLLRVPVDGPACAVDDPDAGERFELGPLHTAGEPHARVPDDRAALEVSVEIAEQARLSGPLDYVVRLTNPTARPITLDPCPAYATGFYRKDSTGESYSQAGGRLNCEAAPSAVPPGGSVAFAMRQTSTDPDGVRGPDDARAMVLLWRIAGPATGSAAVPFPGGPDPSASSQPVPVTTATATPGGPCRAGDLEARFDGRRAVTLDGEPRIDRFLVVRKTTAGRCVLRGTPTGWVWPLDSGVFDEASGDGTPVGPAKQPSPENVLLDQLDEAVAVLQHGTCPPPTGRTLFFFSLPSGDSLHAFAPDEPAETDGGALHTCDLAAYAFRARD